jgi:hypothetical protein
LGNFGSAYMDILSAFSPAWDEYIRCRTQEQLRQRKNYIKSFNGSQKHFSEIEHEN